MTTDPLPDLQPGHRQHKTVRTVLNGPTKRTVVDQCQCGALFMFTKRSWEAAHKAAHLAWRKHARGGE